MPRLPIESLGEFSARVKAETAATVARGKWGGWTLDPDRLELRHEKGGTWRFPLTECDTSGQVLYYLTQAANKAWVSDEDCGHLVRALVLFFHPQRNLCNIGVEKWIDDVTTFLRNRLAELTATD